jgi:hypothetical protein
MAGSMIWSSCLITKKEVKKPEKDIEYSKQIKYWSKYFGYYHYKSKSMWRFFVEDGKLKLSEDYDNEFSLDYKIIEKHIYFKWFHGHLIVFSIKNNKAELIIHNGAAGNWPEFNIQNKNPNKVYIGKFLGREK